MLLLILACTLTHGARPLGEGVVAVDVSAGGPITELFGGNIPLPLSGVGVGYGVSDRLDVHANVNTTAAALFGLAAGQVGTTWVALPQAERRPRVALDGTVVMAGGDIAEEGAEGGFRALLQPTVLAAWDMGKSDQHTVYAGVGGLVEPYPTPGGYGWMTAGGRLALGNPRWGLTTEAKWLAPFASNVPMSPVYTGVAGAGALSVQIGVDARFGGGAR